MVSLNSLIQCFKRNHDSLFLNKSRLVPNGLVTSVRTKQPKRKSQLNVGGREIHSSTPVRAPCQLFFNLDQHTPGIVTQTFFSKVTEYVTLLRTQVREIAAKAGDERE